MSPGAYRVRRGPSGRRLAVAMLVGLAHGALVAMVAVRLIG